MRGVQMQLKFLFPLTSTLSLWRGSLLPAQRQRPKLGENPKCLNSIVHSVPVDLRRLNARNYIK